jgi:hypothetical protein
LCLVSFGTITFVFARELADGSGLARGLCLFLAVFWTVRLVAATFVFDVRPPCLAADLLSPLTIPTYETNSTIPRTGALITVCSSFT